jgi:hypothetical protein
MQVLSSTNITTNIATPTWICPTNVGVDLYFDSVRYQSFSFDPTLSAVGNYTLSSNETKAVYHLVAQPRGGGGYRGDPRFSAFTNSVVSAPMSAPPLQLNSEASLGTPNTNGVGNWQVDQYTSAANSPDIVPSDLFFSWDNRGIPQWAKNKLTGAGDQFSDLGMIGDVPVTTKTGEALAWSTPRLWGRGRPTVNGQSYPPDWLLLDCFHFALFNAEPQFSGSTNRVFKSYGKMNVNSAKSFFQKPSGNANASDTIMDSITRLLMTKDVRMVFDNSPTANQYSLFTPLTTAGTQRTNFLNKVAEITATRNSSDTPYTTTFEFLGDLSASRMPGDPSWWYAPIPVPAGSTNLNSATNTTDRLAESVVRGLVNKLTTHGNQFSIFSLGQALQVANGKTNVVGEAYLQAVYERAPLYDESTGAITNSPTGAPAMRQIYLRELRY